MKTVGYYLDYAAQSFGLTSSSAAETQHLSLFKKYLNNVLEDWESKGDMDYLKQLGTHLTRAPLTGTVTANLGEQTITLSTASNFYAVGCDIQINNKTYLITSMTDTTNYTVWPAFLDADTTTDSFEIRYNRFPVPPYFSKILNRRLVYLNSITDPISVVEHSFSDIPKDNTKDYPVWFQIKYTARQAGYSGTATVASSTVTVATGTLTDYMANMPIRFVGTEEVYYLRDITTGGGSATLDRDISTDISVAVAFEVLPVGSFMVELYPHPHESKQIIYDYLETETQKAGTSDVLLAPSIVIEAGLDYQLAKFTEDSAATKTLLLTNFTAKKEEAKAKTVTNYTPSLKYVGKYGVRGTGLLGYPSDYNRRNHRRGY